MTDLSHDQLPQVTQIFINLGAPESQAQVMAAQLLKRAEQIAEERQISRVEATETLLKQVIEARQGA
ncbi:hypothetical protein ACWPKO_01040 [Coraliomargarita sp. W4R53]